MKPDFLEVSIEILSFRVYTEQSPLVQVEVTRQRDQKEEACFCLK